MSRAVLSLMLFLGSSSAFATAYDAVVTKMNQIASEHPEYVTLVELGQNDQGQVIQGLEIDVKAMEGEKSHHLVVGAHHGNERLSVTSSLDFIEFLIETMQDPSSDFHNPIAQYRFYVFPVLNIGGYNANRREEYSAAGRSHDPNRDYPDACVQKTNYYLKSTKQLAEFTKRANIVAAVTIHGYIGTFTYPWGIFTSDTQTLDHGLFAAVARDSVRHNGYRTGTHADAIYPTAGAYEDWAYFERGVWVMLLELRRNANIRRDSKAMMEFFAQAPTIRSEQHAHTGTCRRTVDGLDIRARP